MSPKRLAIGAETAGWEQKYGLAAWLDSRGCEVIDCGAQYGEKLDFTPILARISQAIGAGAAEAGILLTRHSAGPVVAANRLPGIRASAAADPQMAHDARAHCDANLLIIGTEESRHPAQVLVRQWLEGGALNGRRTPFAAAIEQLDLVAGSCLPTHRVLQVGQSIWLEGDLNAATPRANDPATECVEYHGARGAVLSLGHFITRLERLGVRTPTGDESAADHLVRDHIAEEARRIAEVLLPVHSQTGGDDGFVCIDLPERELPADLAFVVRAQRLLATIGCPNVMLKVPATERGLRAVHQLTAEGIHTCVTGVFSERQYRHAVAAYMGGLRNRQRAGQPISAVRSVAAVGLMAVDAALEQQMASRAGTVDPEAADEVRHHVALAACRDIHQTFRQVFFGDPFRPFARAGAAFQSLLWTDASPAPGHALPPSFYAEKLVAPYTHTALRPEALHSFLAHGRVWRDRLLADEWENEMVRERLSALGINLDLAAEQLQHQAGEKWRAEFELLTRTTAAI